MVELLQIDRDDAIVYIALLKHGRMSNRDLSKLIGMNDHRINASLSRLVGYGACIEIDGKYEALHPKFAITNMYKMRSLSMDGSIKRNGSIDALASMLMSLKGD